VTDQKKIIASQMSEICNILTLTKSGLSRGQINENLPFTINNKTLQRRIVALIDTGAIYKTGEKRTACYHITKPPIETQSSSIQDNSNTIFSEMSRLALQLLENPVYTRQPVSYNSTFLDNYVPNTTMYVPINTRTTLQKKGQRMIETAVAAGTYARHILNRLLVDLSYHSSRLEGNTYSKLDTQRLIEQNIEAEGKVHEETVMIMNHKEAIAFLVENADVIEPNTVTVYGLHHLLSQDLIANSQACGRVRQMEVSIGRSAYKPLNNPHVLAEMLQLLLLKARQIKDPFEQSFFLLLHISYLQAFEDVNKRTARLACNIPFIQHNLCPLSFTDLPKEDYIAALLVFYETNDTRPLLDVFCWAYKKSCEQYDAVKETIGPIDGFRVRYRQQRKTIMGIIIRDELHGSDIEQHIRSYCDAHEIANRDKFIAMTLADLDQLHEGTIIGLGITEGQFNKWKKTHT